MNQFEYIKKLIGDNDNFIRLSFINNFTNKDDFIDIYNFHDEVDFYPIKTLTGNVTVGIIGSYGLKFLYDTRSHSVIINQQIKEREQIDGIIQDWYDSILEKWYLNNTLNEELNLMEAKTEKKNLKKRVKI